jgi:hypothetical protein
MLFFPFSRKLEKWPLLLGIKSLQSPIMKFKTSLISTNTIYAGTHAFLVLKHLVASVGIPANYTWKVEAWVSRLYWKGNNRIMYTSASAFVSEPKFYFTVSVKHNKNIFVFTGSWFTCCDLHVVSMIATVRGKLAKSLTSPLRLLPTNQHIVYSLL